MNAQNTAQTQKQENAVLWTPSQEECNNTFLQSFITHIEQKYNISIDNYQECWEWSVNNIECFWSEIWDFCGVIGHKGENILKNANKMPGAQFFPDSTLNYAENLLRRKDNATAIIFRNQREEEQKLSFKELYDSVSQWQQAFIDAGIRKGDRVAGYMPNMPETIIAMLAASSLGAIWSSASPDFGAQGVLDRFGQIEPKIIVCVDGYFYDKKELDCLEKISQIQSKLTSLKNTIIVPFLNNNPNITEMKNTTLSSEITSKYTANEIKFEQLPFNHPLFIMFSSGTTGAPKCIVHGQGGTLLQHMKEHKLQNNIHPEDRVFYFTTCGWMMWNWLVSALASEACLMLFDGSPFYPSANVLWNYAQDHKCSFFGTSAKYIDALKNEGLKPCDTHNLSCIRTIASTGSPLVHESFDYVYNSIKSDTHLASISGGTDIVSCFVLGNPTSPVYRGEIQGAGLGMHMSILDENGQDLDIGAGEMVCKQPFPCMPIQFWNDDDGSKYKSAYFESYENIWCHGDWVEKTENGGFIIHGRSDATLNPGGVRIGTAEIYRQVEQIPAIKESVCVGQDWDGDVRVILFVTLNDGYTLDENLTKELKTKIRTGASPRHVPAKILSVSDIPRTKSGKITELAVRDIIMNRPIKNKEALANPEALNLYKNIPELQN